MTVVMLISWTFPLVLVAYLATLVAFISMMGREHQEFWQSIGSPSLWEPNGQLLILKSVFLPRALPAQIAARHRLWLSAIRALAALGMALFLSILLMIWAGKFESH